MKTKQILYSVALAATMVACSQEELTIPASDTQDLSNRPLLGDITLVDATAETRFATGSGAQPVFADGDKVGACIMDEVIDATASAIDNRYKIVNYYSSNSAFTRVDGAWKLNSDMPLVEGNYLFYAPYNAALSNRGALSVRVPAQQNAATAKSALDDFYASGAVVRVGYVRLAANQGVAQKPVLDLNDVFSYPMITIENNFDGYLENVDGDAWTAYSGTIKVDSIQLQIVDGAGNVKNNIPVAGSIFNGTPGKVSAVTDGVVGMMKTYGKWASTPMENYTSDIANLTLVNTVASSKDRLDGNITTLVAGRDIAQGSKEEFYCVMPAMKIDASSGTATSQRLLNANIFVKINGKRYVIKNAALTLNSSSAVTAAAKDANGLQFTSAVKSINLIKGQKYPQEELNFDNGVISKKASAGSILTINLKGGKSATGKVQIAKEVVDAPAAVQIKNNTDFINFFKEQLNGSALEEKAAGNNNGTQFVFASNTTATINSELIDALSKYNNNGTLQIDKALVVDNDVQVVHIGAAATGYYPVTFMSTSYNTYTINLKSGSSNYTVEGLAAAVGTLISNIAKPSVHVMKGATKAYTADATVGNVRNDGTISVAASKSLNSTILLNNGTVNLTGKILNTVTNNNTINVLASAAAVTVKAGTGVITVPYANIDATVAVIGGTQTGICEGTLTAANVKNADKVEWINAFRVSGNANITAAILAEMVDINKIYAQGAQFATGSFDMEGKTLVIEGDALHNISGDGISSTTVSNITIRNTVNGDVTSTAANKNVTLNNIAATGIYSKVNGAGKILANGTDATWNGAAAK